MSQGHFGNLCDTDNFGDPVVLYDSFEDRWIITDFAFKLDGSGNVVNPPGAFQCFAVSKTGDPVNGGWNFYSIAAPGASTTTRSSASGRTGSTCRPTCSATRRARSYQGFHMWALNKQQMYNGDPSPQVVDFSGTSSDFTVIPANSRLQTGTPPAGSPEYFRPTEQFLNARLDLQVPRRLGQDLDVDVHRPGRPSSRRPAGRTRRWRTRRRRPTRPTCSRSARWRRRSTRTSAAPSRSGSTTPWIVARSATPSCGATTAGNATSAGTRPMSPAAPSPRTTSRAHATTRTAANTFFRFMPALAVDRVGDLAITYTKSNSTTNPQIKYAGRLAGDPVNTLPPDRADADRRHRRAERQLRALDLHPLGRLQRHGARPERLRVLDDRRVLRDHRAEPPDPHRLVPLPGLHARSATARSRAPSPTARTRSRARPSRSAAGRRRRTAAGSTRSPSRRARIRPRRRAKPGFDPASAATIVVPDGGTLHEELRAHRVGPERLLHRQLAEHVPARRADGLRPRHEPGQRAAGEPGQHGREERRTSRTAASASTARAGPGRRSRPTVTGQLTRVDLELFCSGCTGTTPNLTVSIRATTGATPVPTGADLATATIPGFNSGSGGFLTSTFASPATLTAGTRYAIVFRLGLEPRRRARTPTSAAAPAPAPSTRTRTRTASA